MLNFLKLCRTLLRIPVPSITPGQAVLVARKECDSRGLVWTEPVIVQASLYKYRVVTRANTRPVGPWFEIDIYTGEILKSGVPLR
jgi:hypothetical protein